MLNMFIKFNPNDKIHTTKITFELMTRSYKLVLIAWRTSFYENQKESWIHSSELFFHLTKSGV